MPGIKRRASSFDTERIDHLYVEQHIENARFFLHYGEMTDATNLIRITAETKPTEIYDLAAQSHLQVSFETPLYNVQADAVGTLRILEAIRILELEKAVRFYQASTFELYGKVQETPHKETPPFYPRSPFAAAADVRRLCACHRRNPHGTGVHRVGLRAGRHPHRLERQRSR